MRASERPIGLGSSAHYVGVRKYNRGEEWKAEVTEPAENKSMTMLLKAANKHRHDRTNYFKFEPTTKETRFTMSMKYKLARASISGRLLDVLVARRMVKGWLTKMAENIKRTLET